ncbi:MAG TPA: glycosyltransferase family 2 protein, partial [Acidimicrobiales bacterium]|nr:glycosyltransferase family 2 protein [Acidimicrobiales bacterium]
LLNPDTEVLPGAVRRLRDFARENPKAGLVGGRTLTAEGATEPSCCWGRPTMWSTFCFASGLSTAFRAHRWFDPEAMGGWDRDTPREVGVVTGCLVMVHRDVWAELGGFDPRFFMYGEDTDLSLRARKAGYRPMITPTAEIVHTIGASSSVPTNRRVMIMRGKVTVFHLHWGRVGAKVGAALLLAGVALRAALGVAKGALGRSRSIQQDAWVGTWQRRREWIDGYPPYDPTPAPAMQPVG